MDEERKDYSLMKKNGSLAAIEYGRQGYLLLTPHSFNICPTAVEAFVVGNSV